VDRSTFIRDSVEDVQTTLVIGGLLILGLMQIFDGRDPLRLVRAGR